MSVLVSSLAEPLLHSFCTTAQWPRTTSTTASLVRKMAYRIQPSRDTLRLSFSHPAAAAAAVDAVCRYRREATGSLIFAMAVCCRGHAPGEFIIIFTCGACQCTVTTRNYRAPSRRRRWRWRWQRVKSPSTAAAFLCIVWVSVWCMHINTYILVHSFGHAWVSAPVHMHLVDLPVWAWLNCFHFCLGSCQHYR